MTFTEAAVEVLRREGKPLHFKQIAEIAARESLLDHVGKIPEETMAGQLVAHCRLPHGDRLLHAVEHGVFALVEWQLPEDPAGIENLVDVPPEEEPPYRGRERHPIPSRELARGQGREGREGRGRRREEEERRGKRFPPPAEVAYEILAGAGRPLGIVEIAAQGAERMLMPDAFVRDVGSLRAALQEDNRRRESSGRRPLFAVEGDEVTLVAQPEPGERAAAPAAVRAAVGAAVGAGELRKAALAALRRRMRECDGPTFEHLAGALLERLGYGELKVVKRGREHAVYVGRRRLGAAEIRHVFRVVRAHADVGRRDVQDLRRDVGNYGAQIGVVIATGDVQREARGDATAAGQLPVILLCGEALAEAAAESATGCRPVVVPELDEGFFREAALKGAEEETARRARREERERRDGRRGEERRRDGEAEEGRPEATISVEAGDGTPEAAPAPEAEPSGDGPAVIEVRATLDEDGTADDDGDEGDEEGDDGAEPGEQPVNGTSASGGQPGEGGEGRRRRRRRRRRRGGRGRREGAPGAPGAPAEGGAPSPAGEGGTNASAPPPPPPAVEPPPGGGEPTGG